MVQLHINPCAIYICMRPHSNCDGSRLRMDIDCGGLYDAFLCCWLWTNSTYVYLFWCTFEFECVVAWLRWSQLLYATTLQWWRLTTSDWYWFRWNIRHIVMLTLDEQHVRQFVLVHIRICMCCCLLTMVQLHINPCAIYICMRPHSNCDGSRLRMDIDCGGWYDAFLCCWLWTNSTYVNLFWCTVEFACFVACWGWCNYT